MFYKSLRIDTALAVLIKSLSMKEVAPASIIEIAKNIGQGVLPGYEEEIASALTFQKRKELEGYFTNVDGRVTAWKGNPRDMTSAVMTARESRAGERDITELFWKEFRKKFGDAVGNRVVNEFGDDSVREDGSAYLYVQDISVLTSLYIFFRHPLVTGIEASTRYINWGELPIDDFVVHPDVVMNNPEAKQLYEKAAGISYETYKTLWQPVWDYVVSTNSKPEGMVETPYKIAVKGAVCDALRGLLPLGVKTNLGIHSDFRTLSELIMDLKASEFSEAREIGEEMAVESKKVNPVFMGIVDNDHGAAWTEYQRKSNDVLSKFGKGRTRWIRRENFDLNIKVEVLNKNPHGDLMRGALVFNNGNLADYDDFELNREFSSYSRLEKLLDDVSAIRTNRRHKVDFINSVILRIRFENLSFGSFKDFNRHRPLLIKSEPDWSGERGFVVPDVIEKIGGEVREKYINAQRDIAILRQRLGGIYPEEAKLLNTHGTKSAFEIEAGLSEGFWISELRSLPSNNPENRKVAMGIHKGIVNALPIAKHLEKFVDQNEYTLGRIGEAVRADLKGK